LFVLFVIDRYFSSFCFKRIILHFFYFFSGTKMSDDGSGDEENVEVSADVETGADGTRDFDFTEVSHENYGEKMKDSCCGVFGGIFLFFCAFALLIWNEGRTVKRAKDLDEGRDDIVQLELSDFSKDLSAFENKLIHVTGPLSTTDTLMDPIFGVGFDENSTDSALKLSRDVEMYQWRESSTTEKIKTSTGGTRTETTYSYNKVWSSSLISSASFKNQQQLEERYNPSVFPFPELNLEADPILLGDKVVLGDEVKSYVDWYRNLAVDSLSNVPDTELAKNLELYGQNGYSYGNGTVSVPQVGDARITFQYVPADTISVVGLYTGENSLSSYSTNTGGSLLLVKQGTFTSDAMFQEADEDNTTVAWLLRFVGFVLMVISILLMLQPIATAVDIIPFVGDYLQDGLENCIFPTIAILISIPVSLFTIALAWLAYRPIISVPILVGCGSLIVCMCMRHRNKQQQLDEEKEEEKAKIENPYSTPAYNPTATAVPVGGDFGSALDNDPPPAMPPPTGPDESDVYIPSSDVYVPNKY
jgi:hypothetical protein